VHSGGGTKRVARWALTEDGAADRIDGAAPGDGRHPEVDKRTQVGLVRSVRPDDHAGVSLSEVKGGRLARNEKRPSAYR